MQKSPAIKIRRAKESDHEYLSDLALRSKSHWDYPIAEARTLMPTRSAKALSLIKKTFLFLPLFFIFSCSSLEKHFSKEDQLFYTIEPLKDKTLKVTLELIGSKDGTTYIKHKKTWAGNDFTQDVGNFNVLNEGATLADFKKGYNKNITKAIKHLPSEKLKITYTITQNVPSPDKTYKAIIKKDFFHIIGHSGFAIPSNKEEKRKYLIHLDFKSFPKDFNFANSFFALKKSGSFVATTEELLHALYIGGDYRIKKIVINNKPLYVSVRGKWKFKDSELFNLAKNVVEYQRNFFNDHDFDQFFINVLPNERECCSSGGTGLTRSFASFLPNDATLDSHVKYLLSHELLHTWNGHRIKRQEPEQLVYWFSEGFTDYYSRIFLLRSGDITLKEFVEDYNGVLYRYYTSKALNYPNQRILKDFWNDYDVEKLPYKRGNILARKWNAEIKNYSKNKYSLDNILADYFTESKTKNTLVSEDSFIRIAGQYYPEGFKKDLQNLINNGKTITPGTDDLGPCVKRIKVELGKFKHGYDSKKTYKSGIITGLKKNSPAYKAGLRNGHELLDRKMIVPPIKPSWIKIKDKSGKEKKITFYPVDKKRYPAYQYELNQDQFNIDPERCLAWFR